MCTRFDDDVRIAATDVADGEVETALDANSEQTQCFIHQRRRRRRKNLPANEALSLETNQTLPFVVRTQKSNTTKSHSSPQCQRIGKPKNQRNNQT